MNLDVRAADVLILSCVLFLQHSDNDVSGTGLFVMPRGGGQGPAKIARRL